MPLLEHEPHKIKTIRPVSFPTLEERKRFLAKASFNVFNLTPSQVAFDMCSLGTSAMSQGDSSSAMKPTQARATSSICRKPCSRSWATPTSARHAYQDG